MKKCCCNGSGGSAEAVSYYAPLQVLGGDSTGQTSAITAVYSELCPNGNLRLQTPNFIPGNYLKGSLSVNCVGTAVSPADWAVFRVVAVTPTGDVQLNDGQTSIAPNDGGEVTVPFFNLMPDGVTSLRVDIKTQLGNGAVRCCFGPAAALPVWAIISAEQIPASLVV